MRLVAVCLLAVSVAAWMPPPGTVEQFTPEIPKESLDLSGYRKVKSFDPYKLYVNTLLNQGIEVEVTDDYTDQTTGMRHIYTRQVIQGLAVENAVGNLNINKKGEIVSNYNTFLRKHQYRATAPVMKPTLDAVTALKVFSKNILEREVPDDVAVESDVQLVRPHDVVMDTTTPFANQPMYADLRLLQLEDRSLRLIWQLNADFEDAWYDASVDAHSGETLQLVDFVHWYTYEVYPHYVVSPVDGPDAARKIEPELIDSEYSPLGWHDMGDNGGKFRNTQGNNVRAQENLSGSGGSIENKYRPTANAADEFHFPLDLTLQPDQYLDAAITSLFYHCNVFHDFLYKMGFDEVSGNFQKSNFGRGGRENDPVTAQCQDGAGTNNANFATPADGSPGRMRMYVWTYTNPRRDGDFDSGIIYHEFGHGVSNRLTGGPSQTGCLGGAQPGGMGEGWSDFYGIMFRHRPEYNRNMVFGTGGYVTEDLTIRNWPYSTNRTVAPQLYTNVPGLPIHQIGAVWCTFLYEVYWNFVDQHGFDPDWINGSGGNQRLARAVHDGMKMQPCRPTIVDARDSILDAIRESHGDADWCLAWDGFALRGLGTEAPTNARQNSFTTPPECAQILRDAGYTAMQLTY